MIKKTTLIFLITFSIKSLACPDSYSTDHPEFCPSFKTAAICYCSQSGLPSVFCQNVDFVYQRMISFFGSLERACKHQKHTSVEKCIDNWNCYLQGGYDSEGKPCSNTTKPCKS